LVDRKLAFIIIISAALIAATATVLLVRNVGEAGAGKAGVHRGGYVVDVQLVPSGNPPRFIKTVNVIYYSEIRSRAQVSVAIKTDSGVARGSVTVNLAPGINKISVRIFPWIMARYAISDVRVSVIGLVS